MCGQYGGGVFLKFQEESMETEMRKLRSVVSAKAAHANGADDDFPHSVAKAIVHAAEKKNLKHSEEHAEVEYIVARVLPEDKLNIINEMKQLGHKVVMVGDGINDSPALAAADVSVAMKDASDIAREVADVTLLESDLGRLVVLRDLSENLFKRIYNNYRFTSVFNSGLILPGIAGVISPVTSALVHNLSTMAMCANSMRAFLEKDSID